MSDLILLANADAVVLRRVEALLTKEGYVVAAAEGFLRAKELLNSFSPDLLVADVRLGAFNGLHLAFRARLDNSNLPVIITDERYDSVLEEEATRLGATYVVKPLENTAFLACVRAALEPKPGASASRSYMTRHPIVRPAHQEAFLTPRRWPRKQIFDIVEARAVSARARVLDVSYGGLRLAFEDFLPEVPTAFDITLPTEGITLAARRVWMSAGREGEACRCGAEVAGLGMPASSQWRAFVDSVRPQGPLASASPIN